MTVMPDDQSLASLMAGRKRGRYDAQRTFAQKLAMQGSDTSPVQSPWQGVGRLGQALAGAFSMYQANAAEEEATQAEGKKLAEVMAEPDPTKRMAGLTALGGTGGLQAAIASTSQEVAKKRQRDEDLQASSFLLGGGSGPQQATGGAANVIGGMESSGRYDAIGPDTGGGKRAHGKYQVMDFNIGPWTKEILGKEMTPQEFLANPQAQDAVFNAKFGQYQQQYGSPEAAARAWFAGPGGMNNPNAKDVLGTTVQGYGQKFAQAYGPGAGGANLPQGSADGSGSPLPPQQNDPGAQFEMAARRAHAAGRGDIAVKYMQEATKAREAAAVRDQNRTMQHVDLGDSIGILDSRTGSIVQRIPKGTKPGAGEGGAFAGQGMENQARSALVRAAQDPAFASSPVYAAAHSYLSKPRFDAQSGTTIPPEDLSRFPPPSYSAQPQAPQGMPQQAAAAPPQVGAQPGTPPAPSPSVVSGPTMQVPPQPGGMVATPVPGLPPKEKPLTEAQAKAYGFSQRMATANTLLDELAIQGTSSKGRFLEALPGGVGNFAQSPEFQRFEQAKRNFMNAQLRDESGAVIGPSEFMSADKQYFPQPGQATNKELLAQMAENRRQVVEAMMVKAGILKPGQRYEPPKAEKPPAETGAPTEYDYVNGKLVPRK
jgi:hypothetical protein